MASRPPPAGTTRRGSGAPWERDVPNGVDIVPPQRGSIGDEPHGPVGLGFGLVAIVGTLILLPFVALLAGMVSATLVPIPFVAIVALWMVYVLGKGLRPSRPRK